MSKGLKIALGVVVALLLVVAIFASWAIGTYNKLISTNEGVTASWGQVQNQYQRRYDLIPNLVETVKGFAKQEESRNVVKNWSTSESKNLELQRVFAQLQALKN